jgi:hypothetical protein
MSINRCPSFSQYEFIFRQRECINTAKISITPSLCNNEISKLNTLQMHTPLLQKQEKNKRSHYGDVVVVNTDQWQLAPRIRAPKIMVSTWSLQNTTI